MLLSVDELKKIGISLRKAECIRQIAFMVENGSLNFGKLKELSDAEIIKSLTAIKGIGTWTAKCISIKSIAPTCFHTRMPPFWQLTNGSTVPGM